ncbi:hypothetical protein [Amycolatopsis sp. H20-H5]|uniref:hypothetical protein n=1 Tax=Amycolatopsis sp. H20-H5 TaxID=3046309 RepID=UPI002DBBAC30|nr:hypothetical protein [Amycolatopsis sp. H20-H5]MEC3977879.1 hypothetical protein [Amycolatopsis sp. H20-H5]
MSPPKTRANGSVALFAWNLVGEPDVLTPGNAAPNPLTQPCRRDRGGCGSAPFQRCTSPSRRLGGRRNLDAFHTARTDRTPQTGETR